MDRARPSASNGVESSRPQEQSAHETDLGKSTEQSVHETGQVQSMPEDNAPMVNQDGSWTGCTLFLQRIVERLH